MRTYGQSNATVRTLGEAGRTPIEVIAGRVAVAAPGEIVQPRPAAALLAGLANIQECAWLVLCPEAVNTRGVWDEPASVGLVEIMPL
jgi:hypothetical protein